MVKEAADQPRHYRCVGIGVGPANLSLASLMHSRPEITNLFLDKKETFGWHDGQLLLADEVLTPDSSRYWPRDGYKPGGAQPSFDKQFVNNRHVFIVHADAPQRCHFADAVQTGARNPHRGDPGTGQARR